MAEGGGRQRGAGDAQSNNIRSKWRRALGAADSIFTSDALKVGEQSLGRFFFLLTNFRPAYITWHFSLYDTFKFKWHTNKCIFMTGKISWSIAVLLKRHLMRPGWRGRKFRKGEVDLSLVILASTGIHMGVIKAKGLLVLGRYSVQSVFRAYLLRIMPLVWWEWITKVTGAKMPKQFLCDNITRSHLSNFDSKNIIYRFFKYRIFDCLYAWVTFSPRMYIKSNSQRLSFE